MVARMSYTVPNSQLLSPNFSDDAMLHIFSDAQFIEQMLMVEGALAQVQGVLGVIPETAVKTIIAAIPTFKLDWTQLQIGIDKAGVPVPELVRQLRQHVAGTAAAYVHWGATTQDIMDTAVVLQIKTAVSILEELLFQTQQQLAKLAQNHRHTIMAGRTHSQHALPTTFGYKVAGWLAPLLRHQERLEDFKARLLVVQCGGAIGTMAAMGEHGLRVQDGLAKRLALGVPKLPWHTQRDNLIEVAGWLSIVSGSLAKMAQDIILMAQTEVAELRETADLSRGGSSTMPQKSNPIISEGIIAIARTNAALLSALHQAQIQEHERGTHGWQLEWLNLPQMFVLTTGALRKALYLTQNLVVKEDKMRLHVTNSRGLMMAEAISLELANHLGRETAKKLVEEACLQADADGCHLVDVMQGKTAVLLDWDKYRDESNYLGMIQPLIDQLLKAVPEF